MKDTAPKRGIEEQDYSPSDAAHNQNVTRARVEQARKDLGDSERTNQQTEQALAAWEGAK
jgi:hypothetical protein